MPKSILRLQPQNSFELKKLECGFDADYFTENHECVLKVVDGRNKFISGHSELTKALDELEVSCIYWSRVNRTILFIAPDCK